MGTEAKDRTTMNNSKLILDAAAGMIPRAVDLMFNRIKAMEKDFEFKVWFSQGQYIRKNLFWDNYTSELESVYFS